MYILYKYYVQFVSIFPKLILPHTCFMDVGLLKVCLTSKDQGKELRILSFFCLVWWSSLSALGSYIPWSSLYCWCTWCIQITCCVQVQLGFGFSTLSLYIWTMSWYSSQFVCPCFHLLYALFLCLSSASCCLFSRSGLLPCLLILMVFGMYSS